MPLYDQHLHSWHSFDSRADPAENAQAAIERGLAGLTFTEHFDTHPLDWDSCTYDDAAYSAAIDRLRERFGQRLFIGKGIEVCFQPLRMDFILDLLERHRFDLVILSVHYFGGQPVHDRKAWQQVDVREGTRLYLENVREAARFCARLRRERGRVFDVLGHLDLAKRYTQRFFQTFDLRPFGELLDEILLACLEAELIPEVNTSTMRQGVGEPMPGPETIRRYAALGGQVMSIGSDAHRPEDIGAGLDDAAAMLHAAGLRGTVMFRDREAAVVPLDTAGGE